MFFCLAPYTWSHTRTHTYSVISLCNRETTFYKKTLCFVLGVGNIAYLAYFSEVSHMHLVRRKEKK